MDFISAAISKMLVHKLITGEIRFSYSISYFILKQPSGLRGFF